MPSPEAATFEEYLGTLDQEMVETTRQVFQVMREELPTARETIKWGMAFLTIDGREVAGVGARDGAYELYAPQEAVHSEFSSKLGRVEAGEECLRFRRLADVYEAQLRRMVRLQGAG